MPIIWYFLLLPGLSGFHQRSANLRILHRRTDIDLQQITPLRREVGQQLRIIALQNMHSTRPVRIVPPPNRLDAFRRLSATLQKSRSRFSVSIRTQRPGRNKFHILLLALRDEFYRVSAMLS